MHTIQLGKVELEEIGSSIVMGNSTKYKGLIIIHRIFSGEKFTCFCRMNGGGSLEIKAELHFVSRFVMNLQSKNQRGSLLTIPKGSEERVIPVGDLSESEILLLAAAERRGKDKFSFGCLDAKGKVEIGSSLDILFALRGGWEGNMELVGEKNFCKEVY